MARTELVYDRLGSGEPLVLLHGIGHRRQAWAPVIELLAERFDVIVPDLAGFGESPGFPAGVPYSMDNACADLAANFAAWGIDRPHVVGNSLGGAISLELADRGLVSSATTLSPAGFFGPIDRMWALGILSVLKVVASAPDPVVRAVSYNRLGRKVSGQMLYRHPERASAESAYGDALGMKHASGFFPTIRAGLGYRLQATDLPVPVTVAWGTRDLILPYRQAATARRQLTNAAHLPLPECGHVPMIDEPELVVQVIEQTVARARTARAA